jgi:hypothetical protein
MAQLSGICTLVHATSVNCQSVLASITRVALDRVALTFPAKKPKVRDSY